MHVLSLPPPAWPTQEAAFARKYPNKASSEWVYKTQKYRPPGSNSTYLVPLADMVGERGRRRGWWGLSERKAHLALALPVNRGIACAVC